MKSVVLTAPEKLEVSEREQPSAKAGEVLVQVKAAGIGGTDLKIYKGVISAKLPLVLGQEFAGVIQEVGAGIAGFSKAQRVAVEPVLRDGTCSYCKAGDYCLCDNLKVYGIQVDGGYSEFVSVPAYTLHPLPDNVSFEEGALLVPAAVAHYAVSRAEASRGSTFAIVGAGPIGLAGVQFAKIQGASEIYVAEPLETRALMATSFGAAEILPSEPAKFAEAVNRRTNNRGVDVVIEATGNPDSVDMALASARKGGKVIFAGAFGKPATVSMPSIVRKDLVVKGSWLYPNTYSKTLEAVRAGKVKLKELVSSRFPLSDAAAAFRAAQDASSTKVILQV